MEVWDIYDKIAKTNKRHVRGTALAAEDYHIVVHVWIRNNKGEFLLTKDTPINIILIYGNVREAL